MPSGSTPTFPTYLTPFVSFGKRRNAGDFRDRKCTSSISCSKTTSMRFPRFPLFTKEAGLEEVILTNICHTINLWQETQRVFVWEDARSRIRRDPATGGINARKLNIRLKKPSLSVIDVPVCAENPFGSLYISAEGEVSPCVYLYPPLPSPFKRIFCGKEYLTEKVSFGNILRDPFSAIWSAGNYNDFRNRFH